MPTSRPARWRGGSDEETDHRFFLVVLMILGAPTAFSQKEQSKYLYTYVSQFQVPRTNWAQFAEETEKVSDPVFERLMADGTIVSWGDFETVAHTPDGMTHGSWWQATSFAGSLRVLDELRKAGPRPAQNSATKHEDALMHTNVIFCDSPWRHHGILARVRHPLPARQRRRLRGAAQEVFPDSG